MIVRSSEAWIADGKRDEFMATLVELVATFPGAIRVWSATAS